MESLPFSFITKPLLLQYSKLKEISLNTFISYLNETAVQVTETISKKLPEKFGIIIDGWSHLTTHYVAIYASVSYQMRGDIEEPSAKNNKPNNLSSNISSDIILLSMGIILDSWHNDLGASSQYDYIMSIVEGRYHKKMKNILFLVGICYLRIACVLGCMFYFVTS
jgi:hypothetical protein